MSIIEVSCHVCGRAIGIPWDAAAWCTNHVAQGPVRMTVGFIEFDARKVA